jgi:5-methyltetrahydrofolate--homocysteine methyltransferase
MQATLKELLASGKPVIADGAMGTLLFEMGLPRGFAPELWNVEQPDKIRAVYRRYIEAGSQIILTNSFGGSSLRLETHGLDARAAELNRAAAELARQEAEVADTAVVVAGDIGPTGGLLKPWGTLEFEDIRRSFEEQAGALAAGGADVIWIETMSDLEEVRAAVEGARQAAPDLPLVTTMTFDTNMHTMMGVSPEKAVETLQGFGVLALGGNCGNGVDELVTVIEKMRAVAPDAVLVAKANAGMPRLNAEDEPVYDGTPEVMAEYARTVRGLGAQIIGACCGSTDAHIRAISEALA